MQEKSKNISTDTKRADDNITLSFSYDELKFIDLMLRRVFVMDCTREERKRLADITRKMLYAYAPNTRPTAGVRKTLDTKNK